MIGFNQIYNMALEVVNSLVASRGFIDPSTTVCVICTKSGRIFNGISVNDVHAEVEAMRNMQSFGETAVDSLILVSAASRTAMLPCFSCINLIISINPANAAATVAMPDRAVPFQEILAQNPLSFNPMPQARMYSSRSMPRSSVVVTGRSKGDLMNSKLNTLMAATKKEDSEEDLELLAELEKETKTKKGFLGGLFGKK